MEQWYQWGPVAVIAILFVTAALKFILIQHNTIKTVVENNTLAMQAITNEMREVKVEVRDLGKRVEDVEDTLKNRKGE